MTCKSKERSSCIVYRNESTRKLMGIDNEGQQIFKHNINYVEDRCLNENECIVKNGEPRGLKLMRMIKCAI